MSAGAGRSAPNVGPESGVAGNPFVSFVRANSEPIFGGGGPGEWDEVVREKVQVLEDADGWKLYYAGHRASDPGTTMIGLATSPDGRTWTRFAGNPIVRRDGRNEDPAVLRGPDGRLYMYVEWNDHQLDRFVSEDGYNWREDRLAVKGGAASPVVWFEGGSWYLLYEYIPPGGSAACAETNLCQIHLATSVDGLRWLDLDSNPVLAESDPTVSDSLIKDASGVYHLYYHRYENEAWTPWHATSTDLNRWTNRQPFLRGYSSPTVLLDRSGQLQLYIWALHLDGEYHLFYGSRLPGAR